MAGSAEDTPHSDIARVRLVLARELETINEYEAFAQASSHPEVRAFFLHLAAEEKEHVAEAVHMLRMLDATQESKFTKPIAPDHFQEAVAGGKPAPAPSAAPAPPAPPPPLEPPTLLTPQRIMYGVPATPAPGATPLTVGSLRRTR